MKTSYSFSVIRYVHDIVGGEFVNVGIVLYAPEQNYIDTICTKEYGRLSKLFGEVDDTQFRYLMNFLESQIDKARQQLKSKFQIEGKPGDVLEILYKIIPKDDSSLQFFACGGGLTANPEKTIKELYERYVERYSEKSQHAAGSTK